MNRATKLGRVNPVNTSLLATSNRRQQVKEKPPGNVICMAGGSRSVEQPPFDEANPPLFLQLRSGAWIAVNFADIFCLKAPGEGGGLIFPPKDSCGTVELWITRGSYYRGMQACFQDDQPTTQGESSLTEAVSSGGGSTGG